MSQSSGSAGSADMPLSEAGRAIRARFEAAWQAALVGGEAPHLASYLPDGPETEVTALRGALKQIEEQYWRGTPRIAGPAVAETVTRELLAPEGATPQIAGPAEGETVTRMQPEPGGAPPPDNPATLEYPSGRPA